MDYEECQGSRRLIAAILNQAIVDSFSLKFPTPPHIKYKRKKIILKKYYKIYKIFFEIATHHFKHLFLIDDFFINLKFIRKSFLKIKKKNVLSKEETIYWDSINFLNPSNEVLNIYCGLLDISPKFLCESITKQRRRKNFSIEC